MKIKYSLETRKLRVYQPDSSQNWWEGDIGLVQLAGRAWFLRLRKDLEERLRLLQAEPKSPYEVQEITFLLRQLKKSRPVLVCEMPGWKNPHSEDCRAEWLATLRQVDQELAQKVRQFIAGAGKREYLNGGGSR